MHEKQNRDLYPKIVKTKKKGIIERKPPNDKIIFYKFTKKKDTNKSNTKENNIT
ncbi:MAG: hypothetical protein ACFFAQ_09035 [Promethearchaeota archaeon]